MPTRPIAAAAAALLLAASAAAAAQETEGATTRYPAAFFAPYRPTTALDMVRRLPGFTYDPGNPELRGLSASAGNVVVDGRRPAEKTAKLDDVLQRIAADTVERIDVVRGEGGGIDMLGQPVVANVVLRAGARATTAVTASTAAYGDGRVAPGVSADLTRDLGAGRSLTVSGGIARYVETTRGNGPRVRVDATGMPVERADVRSRAGGTTANLRGSLAGPALGGRLQVNASALWTDYRHRQRDTTDGAMPVTTRLDEDLGGVGGGQLSAELGADWKRNWSAAVDSETTLLARIGRKSFRSGLEAPYGATLFAERDRTSELLGRTTVHARLAPGLSAQLDAEVARNRLVTRSALSFAGVPIPLPNGDATVVESRYDLGGQVDWSVARGIGLEVALHRESATIRADAGDTYRQSYPYWRPRVQLLAALGGGHQVRLRAEREVGQLDFANFAAAAQLDKGMVAAGNVALRPQSAWVVEGRWEWRSPHATNLSLALRHAWLDDVLDRVPVRTADGGATFDAPGNIGRGRQDQAVLGATVPLGALGLKRAELKLDATARRSRVTDPTDGRQRRISGEKPYQLTAAFHQDVPRLKAAWGINVDAGWRTRSYLFNEVDEARETLQLGLFVDWNPRPDWTWHVEVSDAWGRREKRVIEAYGGPRDQRPLLYRDARSLTLGPAFLIRTRRQF
jgi:hypothetical protein